MAAPTLGQGRKHYLLVDMEIKAKDDSRRTFEAALSTSHLDSGNGYYRDIVWPGAYKRTLHHFKSARDPYIPLVDSHRYDSILHVFGNMLDGEERLTGRALRYEKKSGESLEVPEMVLDTEWKIIDGADGDRVLDRLRPGAVRKMSIGYALVKHDYVDLKGGVKARNLREIALREGSLVVFGMNDNAEVYRYSIKSFIADIDARLNAEALTNDEREELKQLRAQIDRALLDDSPEPDAPDTGTPDPEEPKGLAPEAQAALREKILRLKLRRLATRA